MKEISRHLNGMVDISSKKVTKRVARASSTLTLSPKAYEALVSHGSPKGDVFETAKIAGILAAKSTSTLIPMCHPLALSKVSVTFKKEAARNSVTVSSEVVCQGKTGVEMEALAAVTTAALTIYDMMKWADKELLISDVKLIYKSGGKSGVYRR